MSEVDLGPAPKEVDLGAAPKEQDLGPAPPSAPVDDIDHTEISNRLQQSSYVGKAFDEIGKILKESGATEPLQGVSSMSPELNDFLVKSGVFRDPAQGRPGDFLRTANELAIQTPAEMFEMVGRVMHTGSVAGGEVAAKVEEMLGGNPAEVARAKRGATEFGDIAPVLAGMETPPAFSRVTRGADGIVRDDPVGGLPVHQDFEAAAHAVQSVAQGTSDHAQVAAKIRSLAEEHGILPAEVAADAKNDPELAKDLASGSPMLPARYTGFDPIKAAKDQMEAGLSSHEFDLRAKPAAPVPDDLDLALQQRLTWPEAPKADSVGAAAPERVTFGSRVSDLADRMGFGNAARDVFRDLQMKATPMASDTATGATRAVAKDFANTMRLSRWDNINIHESLTNNFDHEALTRMWDAADADTVSLLRNEKPEAVAKLSDAERYTVTQLREHAATAWEEAKQAGVVDPDRTGLPAYAAPRVILSEMSKGDYAGGTPNIPWRVGMNLRTTTKNVLRRKYLTAEATEAAAKGSLGEDATLVRDIRTLPMVTQRLQEATAGRKLINQIRAMSELQDEGSLATVHEGGVPKGQEKNYFTIDHPAFKTLKPRIDRNINGNVLTADGTPVMDRTPLYVRKDFEGPLRAVLSQENGPMYKSFLALKAKSMSSIMLSPALHNMVIYGRALPAVKGNFAALTKMYFDGAKVKADVPTMRQAISDGLVPFVNQHGALQDASSMLPNVSLEAGRSTMAKLARAVPDLFDKGAGDKVGRAIDKAGNFWHNKLLWDRIGDLQAGLYSKFKADKIAEGYDPQTAGRFAAHMANRYTGAIPVEAMSSAARKLSNVMLFSRSYTLGQIGTLKDMMTGLPRDTLAQIERDGGIETMQNIKSSAQRKAIGIVAMDLALFHAGNMLLQSGFSTAKQTYRQAPQGDNETGTTAGDMALYAVLKGEQWKKTFSGALTDEAKNYMRRFETWSQHPSANPFTAFGFMKDVPPQTENEPRGQGRALIGYDDQGTALYMRNPMGKTGEELEGWLTSPLDMVKKKLSPMAKPLSDIYNNADYAGRKVYDPYPDTPEKVLRAMFAITGHFMAAQVPSDVLAGLAKIVGPGVKETDEEKTINVAKVVGPLMGFSISQGAPGGPAMGEKFKYDEEHDFQVQQIMPEVHDRIKNGDTDGAIEEMTKANIPPGLQRYYIQTTIDPRSRTARKGFAQFYNTLDANDKARVDMMLKQSAPIEPEEKKE